VHVASAQGQAIWVLGAGGKAAPLTDWMPEMVFGLDWTPASDAIYFGRGSQVWKVAFDPAVPAAATSWGRIKAGYR